ncbi:GNAT family N-acetyltransferase [Arthrobacter sp. NPDC058097]|uniref:GNAT family N-acetyltransferase n=1 Tax=Arthrobacter sp. NPDC058097 TaxID=3346340 RepID=UPI0036DB2FB3
MPDHGSTTVFLNVATGVGILSLRRATRADLPEIRGLLVDDDLGVTRESLDDLKPYEVAFDAIDSDPSHLLVVGQVGDDVVATLQLTFLPSLSRRGAWRAQIEAVRVSDSLRGNGIGTLMLQWALDQARRRGCSLVQLTTDKSRDGALRFYERLGFVASHEGLKLVWGSL